MDTVAQRIPVSLLELNTFGHAVCMLFIYFLWWEKPFEVDYPTTVDRRAWDIRAFLSMRNDKSHIVESYVQELRAYVESDQHFQALPEVRLFHLRTSCSIRSAS